MSGFGGVRRAVRAGRGRSPRPRRYVTSPTRPLMRPISRPASMTPSTSPAGNRARPTSCGRRWAWAACGSGRADARRRASNSPRSTPRSPKVWTPRTCGRRRHWSTRHRPVQRPAGLDVGGRDRVVDPAGEPARWFHHQDTKTTKGAQVSRLPWCPWCLGGETRRTGDTPRSVSSKRLSPRALAVAVEEVY